MTPTLAIVGAGSWGTQMHLPAALAVQGRGLARYAAVCDLDAEKAAAVAKPLGAAAFTNLDEMLRHARPDGLLLLVGPGAMPGLILRAIGERIPFLCEKPPAPDTATHLRLLGAVGELPHVVGYNRRHAPYMTRAKEWFAGQAVQSVTGLFSRHRRLEPDFSTTTVHAIDAVLFLAGGGAESVHVDARRAGKVLNYFINGFTREGVRIDILVTPDAGSAEEHYIVRSADRDVVVAFPHWSLMDFPGWVERREAKRVVERLGPAEFGISADDSPALSGIVGEHERFVGVVKGEAVSISTLETTLETQRVREKMKSSLLFSPPRHHEHHVSTLKREEKDKKTKRSSPPRHDEHHVSTLKREEKDKKTKRSSPPRHQARGKKNEEGTV